MANQVTATANMTNGSQNVVVPGVDLTGEGIIAGHGFYVIVKVAEHCEEEKQQALDALRKELTEEKGTTDE